MWMGIVPHIPKTARYTLGSRIENKFLDLLEVSYTSYFSEKEKKAGRLSECIFTLDILKFLISTAWVCDDPLRGIRIKGPKAQSINA